MRRLAVIALVVAAALLRPSGVAGQITIPTGSTTTVPPTTTAPVSLVDDHVLVVQAASPGTMALTDEPGAPYSGPVLRCAYFDLIIGGVDIIDIIPVTPTIGETYLWYCWEPGNHPYLEPYSPTFSSARSPDSGSALTRNRRLPAMTGEAWDSPSIGTR